LSVIFDGRNGAIAVAGSTKRRLTHVMPTPPGLVAPRTRSGTSAIAVPSGAAPTACVLRRSRENRYSYCSSHGNSVSSSKPMNCSWEDL
jgi:hypothetical protein